MLENCKSAKERWGGVSEIIDRWLQERQELIVRYYDLVSVDSFPDVEAAVQHLRTFCQLLVDYASAGHFEVFDQLIAEARAAGLRPILCVGETLEERFSLEDVPIE